MRTRPLDEEGADERRSRATAVLPRDLPSLTSLRAAAALAVFLFHLNLFGVLPLPWAGIGYTGVGFFFVLSGFVLTWSTTTGTTARRFYRRRFARVYPSHAAMLIIWLTVKIATGSAAVTAMIVGANVFLIQAWFWNPDVVFGMNGVAWSLSCEAAFYACFPFLVRWLRSCSGGIRWAIPLFWLLSAAVIALQSPAASQFIYHFPMARMAEFSLGIVCALAVRSGWRPPIRLSQAGLLVLVVAVLVPWEQATSLSVPTGVADALMAMPFAAVIVAAAVGDIGKRTRVWSQGWLVYAGQVSFAFYLVHQFVIITFARLGLSGPLVAVTVFAVASVAAIALHHVVERPAQRWISGTRRRGASASA